MAADVRIRSQAAIFGLRLEPVGQTGAGHRVPAGAVERADDRGRLGGGEVAVPEPVAKSRRALIGRLNRHESVRHVGMVGGDGLDLRYLEAHALPELRLPALDDQRGLLLGVRRLEGVESRLRLARHGSPGHLQVDRHLTLAPEVPQA